MKSKFVLWLEHAADIMFSDLWQAKALIVVFGILGVVAFVGAFWNPAHFATTGICAVMVLCGISEYKKAKRK
jgi:predicted phage tail protein